MLKPDIADELIDLPQNETNTDSGNAIHTQRLNSVVTILISEKKNLYIIKIK